MKGQTEAGEMDRNAIRPENFVEEDESPVRHRTPKGQAARSECAARTLKASSWSFPSNSWTSGRLDCVKIKVLSVVTGESRSNLLSRSLASRDEET